MYKFPVAARVQQPYLNVERIYPIQQRGVELIVRRAEQIPNCTRVVIFGSSTTPYCHICSDIDVYIAGCTRREIGYIPHDEDNVPLDIWTDQMLEGADELKEEIERTGVVVYERDHA